MSTPGEDTAIAHGQPIEQGPYVSPMRTTYATSGTRYHYFPQANGSEAFCAPALCRECWREKHWKEGQTHG